MFILEIIDKIKNFLLPIMTTKEFIIGCIVGFFIAGGVFSHWIFGNDNLWEQTLEMFVKDFTGQTIDITPNSTGCSIPVNNK